ncbi:hypothetical protein LHP98_14135 [Rhodobacter sp. Har01]|uniref:hypothetical protein n=1 Tax=Rhodobacter sp. Har01 TaxID=2883999 RepID=UPI001D07A7F3|nr:hypothetical protein [Rhodobacter sp. Har01]MCB6179261.1 hypothetical protein [Rhodobacter sp. Har01]
MTHSTDRALDWAVDVPLMTHPLMRANFVRLMLLTGLLMAALLGGLTAATGDTDAVLPLMGLVAAALAGLSVLFVLVALVVFGNRMHMRFVLDRRGARSEVIDRRAARANRAARVVGALAAAPGVAGAGILAEASKQQSIAWNAVARVRYYKSWNAIALSNSWRTLVTLYCTPANYDTVAAAVARALEARPAAAKAPRKSPLPALLLRSALTVLAAAPLFALPDLPEDALLPALLTLAFALASLWLIPVLGLAVLGGLAWMSVLEIVAQSEVRTSTFDAAAYRAYEVMSGDDIAILALAVVGAAYLVWQTLGLTRGKIRSGLVGDEQEDAEAAELE